MTESPQPEDPTPERESSGLSSFWGELKRRKVMRVAITYAVVAWLIVQVASTTFGSFGIPEWAFRFVVIMLCVFFPVAILLAWAFELTPEGIKTSKTARADHPEAHQDKSVQRKRNRFSLLLAAGLPTAIFGALALFFYFSRSVPETSNVASLEKSIAVLPLANMSPDPENAFFADGVHEDVLTNLSKIKELHVIGRTSTLQYRDTVKTLQQIGEELGVRYLLEGSVRRSRNRVLVTVQLIDAQNEGHLWAENYSRELDDIFAIQADVAKAIAGQLQAIISPEEIEKIEYRPTENLEAYAAYVQARQLLDGSHNDESSVFLKKAVRLDSEFAEAWALLAYNEVGRWNLARRTDPEKLKSAQSALAEAVRIAPDTPAVLFARSTYLTHHDNDVHSAIKLLQRAESIDPKFHDVQWELGSLNHILVQLSEAQIHFESALFSNPLSNRSKSLLLDVYQRLGMWDKAQSFIQKNAERFGERDLWRLKLVQSEFLRTGNKQPLVNAWKSRLHSDDAVTEIRLALEARDYSRIIETLEDVESPRRLLTLLDSSPRGSVYLNYIEVAALAWFELGDLKQARMAIQARKASLEEQELYSFNDPSRRLAELALIYALEGSSEKAEQMMVKSRETNENSPREFYQLKHLTLRFSLAYLVLGQNEKAIDALEQASGQKGCEFLNRQFQLWPFFDRLRGNPRFDALLK